MARKFDVSPSTSYLEVSTPITSAPFTMSFWTLGTDANDDNTQGMSIGNTSSSNDYWYLRISGSGIGTARFLVRDGTGRSANTSNSWSENTWHMVTGVEAASNDRTIYLDADTANKGTNTDTNPRQRQ